MFNDLLYAYFLQHSTFRNVVSYGAFIWSPSPHSQVMFTACELGVFDLLLESGDPLSLDVIAARLGTSTTGMERLLDACVGLKLLSVELTQKGGNKGRRRGITELQSGWGWRVPLEAIWSNPLLKQGHPEQVVWDHGHTASENLQEGRVESVTTVDGLCLCSVPEQ